MRVGFGYDCHQFCQGKHVPIGGVSIPHQKGIKAHSDGDVLLHAISDALLGAASLGDLGRHFSDQDPQYKNIDSSILLVDIFAKLQQASFKINNIDSTVIAEKPNLAEYIPAMRQNIAKILKMSIDRINVKATTNEKMGWLGREEGIAAHAVVLIESV